MRKVSQKVKDIVLSRPQVCARNAENDCQGRLTFEHAIIYGGRQLDEAWAIVILCEYHHSVNTFQDGGNLDKEMNVWYALNQATDDELRRVSKAINYLALRDRLNKKYSL
jgi:hypothetical protein